MGNLRIDLLAIASVIALGACGGNDAKPDAPPVVAPDAPPDAAIDAIPAPVYDFACAATPFPTTAPPKITLGGITVTLAGNGGAVVPLARILP